MATVLTSVGEEWVVDSLAATDGTTEAKWVGSGTGATTAAKGDTGIETETTDARADGSPSAQPSADKIRYVGTQTYGTATTISNAGTLTSSSGGTLVIHGDFTGIAVGVSDKIEFTCDLEIT